MPNPTESGPMPTLSSPLLPDSLEVLKGILMAPHHVMPVGGG